MYYEQDKYCEREKYYDREKWYNKEKYCESEKFNGKEKVGFFSIEDLYVFLVCFNMVFFIDDFGFMMGLCWKEVCNVFKEFVLICIVYDFGGVDFYFLSVMCWDCRKYWDCWFKDYCGIKDGN